MLYFCVDTNARLNGDHEVHDSASMLGCLPAPEDRLNLGAHEDCRSALREAVIFYDGANGCARCAPDCHAG